MEKDKLKISFDINTIDHLGIKLYSTIPPMIAELVSNAWDADAHNVYLKFQDGNDKQIEIKDDGIGMTFDELNSCFLKIGRNRRTDLDNDKTTSGRLVLGKKGLGKLSMFGIGKTIIVSTIKDNLINSFEMDYDKIREQSNGYYEPTIIKYNEEISKPSGTTIIIKNLSRKSSFDLTNIRNNLLSRFKIFSNDFIVHINDNPELEIKENLRLEDTCQFKWIFPSDFENDLSSDDNMKELLEFGKNKGVSGIIMTSGTPLKNEDQGIVLYSRNKLVQEKKKFNSRGNDNFYMYMSGSFDVDFIDADKAIDNCSTDRKSLTWDNYENDDLKQLEKLLEKIVVLAQKNWRDERRKVKEEKISEKGINVNEWLNSLNPAEKPLAFKLTKAIIDNDNLDSQTTSNYINSIKEMYGFQGFRDFTAKLEEMEKLDDENAIKLITDWKIIEEKELAKIAIGKIEIINQFEKYIKNDASETKVLQGFFEEFPWLLDSKMTSFNREVTFTKLLKETFDDTKDKELPEHDRRIDFLCTNDSGVFHIIELKRPSVKITVKQIGQITNYIEFVRNKAPKNINRVEGYLISDNMTYDPGVLTMIDAMEAKGVFVKSYTDLLLEAKRYNQSFIDIIEKIEVSK